MTFATDGTSKREEKKGEETLTGSHEVSEELRHGMTKNSYRPHNQKELQRID